MHRLLHLAHDVGARAHIERFLRARGIEDEVRSLSRESLSVGPLGDVDDGAALRAAWWSQTHHDVSRAPSRDDVDETERWRALAADPRDALVWYGLTIDERLFSLRACWWLSRSPRRVFEATLSLSDVEEDGPIGYWLTAFTPELFALTWSRREEVVDVAARAARWDAIRASSGPNFRHFRGDAIEELPVDAYDREILELCREWTTAPHVIVEIVFHHDIGDGLVAWRIRVLIARGAIETRGDLLPLGVPREIRARATTSTP
jgi:hypothetical protein